MLPRNNKRSIILFAIAGLAIILLAGGLDSLPFDAGRAFVQRELQENPVAPQVRLDFRFIYALLIGLSMLTFFLSREARRKVLIFLLIAGVIGLVIYKFFDQLAYTFPPQTPTALPVAQQTSLPTEIIPTPFSVVVEEDLPMDPPDWLVTMFGVVLAFLLTGVFGLLYLNLNRRKVHRALSQLLLEEAEQASAAIREGVDIHDVILRCYAQMTRHLEESNNLPRGKAVTPREFENTLIRLGFPAISTRTLTRLFEAVRYGRQTASPEQTQQALDSLQAIVSYAEEMGGG